MARVFAQRVKGVSKGWVIRQGPDNRQVVGAGAAKCGATVQGLRDEGLGVQALHQVGRDLLQQGQVAGVFGGCRGQVIVLEVETGP
ncbi:hypothetical protein ALP39_200129 [Pseudomonas marginalis pv. marginalis]|nr:hypothetical protein ALP39_200129 [Pseudomonas marginalis pv. marginalis]